MMNTFTIQRIIKKTALFLIATIILSFAANAQKIAYVDVDKILNSMKEYKTAQKQIDDLAAKWRREIAEEYDQIKGMYNRYQAEQVLLSDEVRRQKEEEIMAKEKEVRELQKQKFGPEGALFQKRQELVEPIQEQVYSAIENFANDKGFDFIFDKGAASGMIFSNVRYDKTDDILKELD